jgi:F-type H+-transporting ATPase subunit b
MLDIDVGTLLTTAIVFLILLSVMNKILYKPLLTFMDQREASIDNDIESAEKNSNDIESLNEEANGLIAAAKLKAAKIKESAVSEAKDKAAAALESKVAELDQRYAEFSVSLQESKSELKNSLLAQLPVIKEGIKTKLSKI